MGEATHRGDALLSQVIIGGTVVLDQLAVLGLDGSTDAVDLLVDLGTMMVTLLTSTSNRELDATGMPGTDTSHLTQTLVSLTGQFLCVPARGNTCTSTQQFTDKQTSGMD